MHTTFINNKATALVFKDFKIAGCDNSREALA
jgi:hypothetical protein